MDRVFDPFAGGSVRVPHLRGDGPLIEYVAKGSIPCSPPAWGWTDALETSQPTLSVFPTCVGMDRQQTPPI
ncbi:MAG: hypothetical protein E1N59_3006 [Puniceicoccaceae bacterium 5H]|nr:MAG: hypothetical protein E1N59_3006 [Puniceicoccaceae bacterium 5H]